MKLLVLLNKVVEGAKQLSSSYVFDSIVSSALSDLWS